MQLRDYRKARGLTLQDMAQLIGVKGANTVHRHENGTRQPDLGLIEKYRKATGGEVVAADWLSLRKKVARKRAADRRARLAAPPASPIKEDATT